MCLLGFTGLGYYVLKHIAPYIEQDILARTSTKVKLSNPSIDGNISLYASGRDIIAEGEILGRKQAFNLLNTANNVHGVRKIHNKLKISKIPELIETPNFSASINKGKITLNGYVASIKDKTEILDHLQRSLMANPQTSDIPMPAIENNLQLAKLDQRQWDNWLSAIKAAIGIVSNVDIMQESQITITGKKLEFSGQIDKRQYEASIRKELEMSLPDSYVSNLQIKPNSKLLQTEAISCDTHFKKALGTEKILFKLGGASIQNKSYAVLNKLASIAAKCPSNNLIIEGHSDNSGQASFNKSLSKKRAAAVVKYLSNKGVASNRLTAIGYGEERPIASNKTYEGRINNRRIEIKVQ